MGGWFAAMLNCVTYYAANRCGRPECPLWCSWRRSAMGIMDGGDACQEVIVRRELTADGEILAVGVYRPMYRHALLLGSPVIAWRRDEKENLWDWLSEKMQECPEIKITREQFDEAYSKA